MIDDYRPSSKFLLFLSQVFKFLFVQAKHWFCFFTVPLFPWHVQNRGQHIRESCAFRVFLHCARILHWHLEAVTAIVATVVAFAC